MTESTYKLPNKEEFIRRMKTVLDTPKVNQLYNDLADIQKEQEKYPAGIVIMLQLFIYDNFPNAASTVELFHLENWIDALVDNPQIASDAKAFYREALKRTKINSNN